MEIIEGATADVKALVGGVEGILGALLDLDAIVKIIADVLCVRIICLL